MGPLLPLILAAHSTTWSTHAIPIDPLRPPPPSWPYDAANPTFAVDDAWVPPWLARLEPSYALALVDDFGCGRGLSCSPGVSFPAEAFMALWDALQDRPAPIPAWKCRERPTTILRIGRERDSFVLLRCDGSLADGAWLRLSLLARPPDVPAPAELPDEPDPRAGPGEWIPGVHLLDPHLLWLLSRISDRFRWRGIYLYSGYRPRKDAAADSASSHGSLHGQGRALDIAVQGIDNEELLAACFSLPDAGCGYYPRNKFVHVDVRPRFSGHFVWVDAAAPGEPSRYVDSWPGVVEGGRVVWQKPGS